MKDLARILALGLFVFGGAAPALAECEGAITAAGVTLTQDREIQRKGVYETLCRRRGGDLIDTADPALKDRLKKPDLVRLPAGPKPGGSGPAVGKADAPTVVIFIVEKTGKLSWAAILQPSGNKDQDELVAWFLSGMTFGSPALLDGEPVAVFETSHFLLTPRSQPASQPDQKSVEAGSP